jgi:hypothetical protein
MGWAIQNAPGSTMIWHDGDVSNFHSHLRLFPDQHLGIVVLMNVGASGNSTAINSLVDGIAATFLGHRPAAPTSLLWTALSRFTVIVPLLMAIFWAWGSYLSLRRWLHRGEPHGLRQFWRLYLPLAVDLCSVGVICVLVPAIVHTPMTAIALFAPDVFVVLVIITGLALGCAIDRTFGASVCIRDRAAVS